MISRWKLENYKDKLAIVDLLGQESSYGDLINLANQISNKVRKQSLVFLLAENMLESIASYLAFFRAKSVTALIDPDIDPSVLSQIISRFKPNYIFVNREKILPDQNWDASWVGTDFQLLKTHYSNSHSIHSELALLISTSGSTGSPRFVRQSYQNTTNNVDAIAKYLQITDTDRAITSLPMHYTYGLSIINSHLYKGASIVLTKSSVIQKDFWKLIQDHHVTSFAGVPYTFEILQKLKFEDIELPSLRYLTQAGGGLKKSVNKWITETCFQKSIKIFVMYGQTEASPRMSYVPWEYAQSKMGSIGLPIPGGSLSLEDEMGNLIKSADTPGELVYKGKNVTLGYAESVDDLDKGDENLGILRTGDIATRDKDGFYFISGRKNRFLKMFGKRVSLDQLEQMINEAGYASVCAGTDDNLEIYVTEPQHKEDLKVFLRLKTTIPIHGIKIYLIKKIPRSVSGKIRYAELG